MASSVQRLWTNIRNLQSTESKGLSVFFATLCAVDLFGVFPIVVLPSSLISCGKWLGGDRYKLWLDPLIINEIFRLVWDSTFDVRHHTANLYGCRIGEVLDHCWEIGSEYRQEKSVCSICLTISAVSFRRSNVSDIHTLPLPKWFMENECERWSPCY